MMNSVTVKPLLFFFLSRREKESDFELLKAWQLSGYIDRGMKKNYNKDANIVFILSIEIKHICNNS